MRSISKNIQELLTKNQLFSKSGFYGIIWRLVKKKQSDSPTSFLFGPSCTWLACFWTEMMDGLVGLPHTHLFVVFCFKSKPQYNKSHSVQYNNMYRIIFWQFGTIIMSTWAEMLPASAGRMRSWTAGFIILVMCCLIFLKTFDSFMMRQKMAATALCHSVRGYWTLSIIVICTADWMVRWTRWLHTLSYAPQE